MAAAAVTAVTMVVVAVADSVSTPAQGDRRSHHQHRPRCPRQQKDHKAEHSQGKRQASLIYSSVETATTEMMTETIKIQSRKIEG